MYQTFGKVEKKTEVSEVFDAKRAPLFVLVTSCATETHFVSHNLRYPQPT